jgi:hypothetical protein
VISEALNYDTLFVPPSTTAKNIPLRFSTENYILAKAGSEFNTALNYSFRLFANLDRSDASDEA